ncbi:hypothetical protein Poly24_48430 [Rosistilla carotiformis]|uniref:Uncharacterized protein n=1 Tax=Rosistilla carotiformis TaxID=2528017 RepID=A0A518JZZ3_9BACT|nr:hypothetical protein [Rosistilla carotiformis]QDV71110.1 hypothetical protein Poly24_48430 [Rosistilla carotiformis]
MLVLEEVLAANTIMLSARVGERQVNSGSRYYSCPEIKVFAQLHSSSTQASETARLLSKKRIASATMLSKCAGEVATMEGILL